VDTDNTDWESGDLVIARDLVIGETKIYMEALKHG
jgi:hypothetical protein